jgi:putative flippase GtrA
VNTDRILNRTNIAQFIKFSFVGVLNTLVGFGSFLIFYYLFNIQYVLSNTLSYIPGLINSFIWNKIWTFASRGDRRLEAVLFLIVFIPCFLIQNGVLIFLKEIVRINVIISQIISMFIYTVLGFILNKTITFNKKIVGK